MNALGIIYMAVAALAFLVTEPKGDPLSMLVHWGLLPLMFVVGAVLEYREIRK